MRGLADNAFPPPPALAVTTDAQAGTRQVPSRSATSRSVHLRPPVPSSRTSTPPRLRPPAGRRRHAFAKHRFRAVLTCLSGVTSAYTAPTLMTPTRAPARGGRGRRAGEGSVGAGGGGGGNAERDYGRACPRPPSRRRLSPTTATPIPPLPPPPPPHPTPGNFTRSDSRPSTPTEVFSLGGWTYFEFLHRCRRHRRLSQNFRLVLLDVWIKGNLPV